MVGQNALQRHDPSSPNSSPSGKFIPSPEQSQLQQALEYLYQSWENTNFEMNEKVYILH